MVSEVPVVVIWAIERPWSDFKRQTQGMLLKRGMGNGEWEIGLVCLAMMPVYTCIIIMWSKAHDYNALQ